MELNPWLIALPVAAAVLIAVVAGLTKQTQRSNTYAAWHEEQRRKGILDGKVELHEFDQRRGATKGERQEVVLIAGSFGAGVAPRVFESKLRAGADEHVGNILVLEPDRDIRQGALNAFPQSFRIPNNRIQEANFKFSGGFPFAKSDGSPDCAEPRVLDCRRWRCDQQMDG